MREGVAPSAASRVRGLLLGLAFGDAVGSHPRRSAGPLPAGVATQLAAWTVEAMLRTATRYGHIVFIGDVERYALQRWVLLRGGRPEPGVEWHPVIQVDRNDGRGWLLQVPAMAQPRGSSPATWQAITTGRPAHSAGCQGMLRCLPMAAWAGSGRRKMLVAQAHELDDAAMRLCRLTHDHPQGVQSAVLGVAAAAACLAGDVDNVPLALDTVLRARHLVAPGQLVQAVRLGEHRAGQPKILQQLAPDATGVSALAGGIYAARSFPEAGQVEEALELAVTAPDPDSVAAVCGALLGAVHGYEALPVAQLSRLELGWVMDRLATDLAVELEQHQSGPGWKSEGPDVPVLDPWWQIKYPGV